MTKLYVLQRVSKKNRKTKEKHRNSAGYESRTEVVKETRRGQASQGLFRGLLPFSDHVQLSNRRISGIVLCLSRGWIVSEKKSKTKRQTQKLGFHRGTAGPKLIGCSCKYENSGFAKGSIESFTEFVGLQVPSRHLSGNSGWYVVGGVHDLYGREIDEIMQEEETEKLDQAGRTGE